MDWQNPAVVTPVVESGTSEYVWPTFNHDIGLTEAREMVGRYKRANPDKGSALAMTRVGLDRILNQQGCVGVKFYFALNTDQRMTLVAVGVDEFGHDMDDGELAERFMPCPPMCDPNSALDS